MKIISLLIVFCLLSLCPEHSHGQEHCMHASEGNFAPLGIMGSHTHKKGSLMFSYQLMHMNMRENRPGREIIEREAVLSKYMMAPTNMHM